MHDTDVSSTVSEQVTDVKPLVLMGSNGHRKLHLDIWGSNACSLSS